VARLGKRPSDPTQNSRPMKVVLDSVDSKIGLLKKSINERESGGRLVSDSYPPTGTKI